MDNIQNFKQPRSLVGTKMYAKSNNKLLVALFWSIEYTIGSVIFICSINDRNLISGKHSVFSASADKLFPVHC